MINYGSWIRFERWYRGLGRIQRGLFYVGLGLACFILGAMVTHEPRERPRQPKIILNCDKCGVDPERAMTYNEYQDQKEQQQQTWFAGEKQRLRQEIWDNRGRARWCRNHPQDRNCK